MGYYITLENADFTIPETPEVLQVLKDLNKRDDLKTGGRSQGGRYFEKWFAWMPADYDQTVKSAQEVFELLGFQCEPEEGLFKLVYYDSKAGSEDLFLAAVAPFVKDGSYLEWRGEDGGKWMDIVEGGVVKSKTGRVVYE